MGRVLDAYGAVVRGERIMKIYADNGEVFFDFTDVDTKAPMDLKTMSYRKFLTETSCRWQYTKKWNVMRMEYEPYTWATQYGNEKRFESLVKSCLYTAKRLDSIEVSPTVEELLERTAKRCKTFYDAEVAKEKEREREEKWEGLCKNGCGRCEKLRRDGDDFICADNNEMLPEKNVPGYVGKAYRLFDYRAFPTDNCPYNTNKTKGAI